MMNNMFENVEIYLMTNKDNFNGRHLGIAHTQKALLFDQIHFKLSGKK